MVKTLTAMLMVVAGVACGSPVRSDVGAKWLENTAIKELSCRDYIQDGLVAIWDGKENTGWGQGDSSLQMVDLVSNVATIRYPERSDSWFLNNSWRNIAISDLGLSVESLTIEAVYRKPKGLVVTARYNPITIIANSEGQNVGWENSSDLARAIVTIRDLKYQANVYLGWEDLESGVGTAWTYDVSESQKASGYVSGLLARQTPNISLSGRMVSHLRLNADSSSTSYAPCYVGCIRLYNRALTPMEVLHNHLVDQLRFGLKD